MNPFPLILCFLVLLLIYVYTENELLIIRRYSVKANISIERRLKIVQISDVHKKRCQKKIITKVRRLDPDIILLTGDIVSRNEKNFSHLDQLTAFLAKICPVYACVGNHELDMPPENYDKYKQIMKKNGVCFLENKQTVLEIHETKLTIAGASLKKSVYKNASGGYSGLEVYTVGELEDALGKKDGYTLLLAHNPLCAEAYCKWGADLVFCGHLHGGILRLPLIGGLLSPERRFLPRYSKGMYILKNTSMIVSAGIGKFRIFNPPEIVYCELFQ